GFGPVRALRAHGRARHARAGAGDRPIRRDYVHSAAASDRPRLVRPRLRRLDGTQLRRFPDRLSDRRGSHRWVAGVRTCGGPARGTTRGDVGGQIERAFGLATSGAAEPDFATAGIELKSVPLRRTGMTWRTKERTTISMIDYVAVGHEPDWEHASVRKKLQKI